jgi:hypothetical protein
MSTIGNIGLGNVGSMGGWGTQLTPTFASMPAGQQYAPQIAAAFGIQNPALVQAWGMPPPGMVSTGNQYIQSAFAPQNAPYVHTGIQNGVSALRPQFPQLKAEDFQKYWELMQKMRASGPDAPALPGLKEGLKKTAEVISKKMGGKTLTTGSKFLGGLLKAIPGVGLVVGLANLAVTYTRKNPPATKAEKALAWTGAIAGGLALIPGAGTVGATVLGGVAAVAGGTGLAISASKHSKYVKEQAAQQEYAGLGVQQTFGQGTDPRLNPQGNLEGGVDPILLAQLNKGRYGGGHS